MNNQLPETNQRNEPPQNESVGGQIKLGLALGFAGVVLLALLAGISVMLESAPPTIRSAVNWIVAISIVVLLIAAAVKLFSSKTS